MPSPDNSPINNVSPSALRRGDVLSPNPGATVPIATSQWQISRVASSTRNGNNSSSNTAQIIEDLDSMDETLSMEDDQPILTSTTQQAAVTGNTRRTVMNAIRNSIPERRRSRTQAITAAATLTQQQPSDELFSSFVMQLAGSTAIQANGAQGFEAIAHNIASQRQGSRNVTTDRQISPLRHKLVYHLRCTYCTRKVCSRAMKAILLADTKIELYSTDIPPAQLHLTNEDRMTHGCHCRIRDTVCGGCGNVLGYHVSQPCERCLDAKNNGHFWMFYSETVNAYERADLTTGKLLYWGALSPMREFEDLSLASRYEAFCR